MKGSSESQLLSLSPSDTLRFNLGKNVESKEVKVSSIDLNLIFSDQNLLSLELMC